MNSSSSLNSQPSTLKVRASERDVSLLTNRSVPTRSISVGCAEENLSSPKELRLVAHQPKLNNAVVNSQFRTHPCVEINLRLNMGIIAHEVHRKLLAPGTEGTFHVTAFPTEEAAQQFHQEQTTKYPPVYREGKIVSGYHPLTPIHPHTRHHAYIICEQNSI